MYDKIRQNLKESDQNSYFLENLLMSIFGGGYADWDMISKCQYDTDDILENLLTGGELGQMDFNDLLWGAIDIYKNNIKAARDEMIGYIDDAEAEAKLKTLDPESDIDAFTNYLDTSMYFAEDVDDEKKEIYKEYLQDAIDAEDEKIGFCYLSMD